MQVRFVAAALLVAAISVVASCGNGSSTTAGSKSRSGPGSGTSSTGKQPGIESYPIAGPVGLVGGGGKVWVVSPSEGTVTARSLATGGLVRTLHVGATPLRAVYYDHLVWVTVFGGGQVVAIDPGSGRIVHRIALAGQPEGLVPMAGSVWVVRQKARLLTEVDANGNLGRSFQLGSDPRLVAAGGRWLFVTDFVDGAVTRIDPRTGTRAVSRRICEGPQGLSDEAGTMWVACTSGDEVIALDEQTLRVLGRTRVANEPDAVRAEGSRLFVLSTGGPTLQQLAPNPGSPMVLRTWRLADAPPLDDRANVDLLVTGAKIWASSYDTNQLLAMPLAPTGQS
jgi:outer membrane protein assembly factor BamB